MDKVVVTGGAGFIGSNLARRLLKENFSVTVIDSLSTGKIENIQDIIDDIEWIEGDVCDEEVLSRVFEGVDCVFHQAAIPSVQRSIVNPLKSNKSNTTGTVNILWYALKKKVRKVVIAASSSAYGDTPTLPKIEDMKVCPLSPYAITKLVGEYYAKVFYDVFGLKTVALRYFNVFGPYQDPTSEYSAVIPLFLSRMRRGMPPIVYGDGEQSRDFTYVENVVDANMLAMKSDEANGKVINIACGSRISLNTLIKKLNKILGTDFEAKYEPPRKGDVKHSLADITLAEKVLGYHPRLDMDEGLKKLVEWFDECQPV